jgi:hypothetical protein
MCLQEQILTELKALAFEILQAPGICEQQQGSAGDAGRQYDEDGSALWLYTQAFVAVLAGNAPVP